MKTKYEKMILGNFQVNYFIGGGFRGMKYPEKFLVVIPKRFYGPAH